MIIQSKTTSRFPDYIAHCPYCNKALPKMKDEFTIDDDIIIISANRYPLFAHNECFRSNEMTQKEFEIEAVLKEYEPHYDLMISEGKQGSSWFNKFDLCKAFDYLMDCEPHNPEHRYGIGRIQHEIINLCLSEGTHQDIRCIREIKRYLDTHQVIATALQSSLKRELRSIISHSNIIRKTVLAAKSIKHLGLKY